MFSVYSDAHTVNELVGFLGRIGESWDLIKRGTKSYHFSRGSLSLFDLLCEKQEW